MMFNNNEVVGNSDNNLILKTAGKIKIQWGKKFIDLLDKDGNLNVKLQDNIKLVSSESEIKKDGFYYLNKNLIAKVGEEILELTSGNGTVYVSFLEELNVELNSKYTALKNIGLVYPTQNSSNIYPTNGIVYFVDSLTLCIVNNGKLSKYTAEIPNPFNQRFVLLKNSLSLDEGTLVIEGEGVSNSLLFNNLKIYSQGTYSICETDNQLNFLVGNKKTASINLLGIETDNILSFNANKTSGYKISKVNGVYVLDIDKINVRIPELLDSIKIILPNRYYNKENIIEKTEYEYSEQNTIIKYIFELKYLNEYLVGDIIKCYIETKDNETEIYKIVSILFTITEVNGNFIHTNNVILSESLLEEININNTFCYLFYRNGLKNDQLIIGELENSDTYNDYKNGIISKLNIFYSAKFDKDGYGNLIFPFYSEELLSELEGHYSSNSYKNVIPPISIIEELINKKLSDIENRLRDIEEEISDINESLDDLDERVTALEKA